MYLPDDKRGPAASVSTPRTRRPTKRALAKARTKARVLDAARELFVTRGFEESTIRDIAATAGLSTGAVFGSFSDKNQLFDAVMMASFKEAFEAASSVQGHAELGAAEALSAMFGAAYRHFGSQLALVRASQAQCWSRPECAHLFETAVARGRGLVELTLHKAVKAGELSDTLDAGLLADMLMDLYIANYRRAVFDGWTAEALEARTLAQARALLCGHLRR